MHLMDKTGFYRLLLLFQMDVIRNNEGATQSKNAMQFLFLNNLTINEVKRHDKVKKRQAVLMGTHHHP